MPRFIPYDKCSKIVRREADRAKRGNWGTVNPVTRKPDKSGAYDRTKQTRRWKADIAGRSGGIYFGHYALMRHSTKAIAFPIVL